jgi:hypothetical protein
MDPAAGDPAGDPASEGPADPAALKAEYAKLPPEELKMHFLAAKEALMEIMGGGGDAAPAPDAPMAPPAPGPGPEASAPAPAFKGEKSMVHADANGGGSLPIKKSESDEVASLKAELAETNAGLEALVKAFTNVVGQPMRKAVTNLAFVPKTGEAPADQIDVSKLSSAQITEKLKAVTADQKLSKSDRDLINGYYVRAVSVDKIAHLLK